jgi:hypothetical protein
VFANIQSPPSHRISAMNSAYVSPAASFSEVCGPFCPFDFQFISAGYMVAPPHPPCVNFPSNIGWRLQDEFLRYIIFSITIHHPLLGLKYPPLQRLQTISVYEHIPLLNEYKKLLRPYITNKILALLSLENVHPVSISNLFCCTPSEIVHLHSMCTASCVERKFVCVMEDGCVLCLFNTA